MSNDVFCHAAFGITLSEIDRCLREAGAAGEIAQLRADYAQWGHPDADEVRRLHAEFGDPRHFDEDTLRELLRYGCADDAVLQLRSYLARCTRRRVLPGCHLESLCWMCAPPEDEMMSGSATDPDELIFGFGLYALFGTDRAPGDSSAGRDDGLMDDNRALTYLKALHGLRDGALTLGYDLAWHTWVT